MERAVKSPLRKLNEGTRDLRKVIDLDGHKLPPKLKSLFKKIGQAADESGVNVYLVGGLPRDILLDQPNLDVDIVVEGDGVAFAKQFSRREGGQTKPHKQFQTAIVVLPKGLKIDVATARTERYKQPGALPVVKVSGIRNDLYRRDFTINSIAIQLNQRNYGKVVDYFGGNQDLKAGIIRVLHQLSFVDDPMRTIRAVRFEQRYGFTIEKKTERLLRETIRAGLLNRVSSERIGKEITLILKEKDPLPAVKRLSELGILSAIHPEFRVDQHTEVLFYGLERIFSSANLPRYFSRRVLYLLALLYPLSPQARKQVTQRLALSKKVRNCVTELEPLEDKIRFLENADLRPSQVYFSLRGLPTEVLLFMATRARVPSRWVFLYLEKLKVARTEISGEELKEMDVPSGPIFQKILDKVLAARLDGEVGSKQGELKLAKKTWREENR